jgi:hypothetical protein
MRRILGVLLLTGCTYTPDPRGQCVNQYIDHYDTVTETTYNSITEKWETTHKQQPVYECDVWVKVVDKEVLVTTKPGHDRKITWVQPERIAIVFNGDIETQQAAAQKLLEAVVHLRRASDALLAVQPIFKDREQIHKIKDDRQVIETKSNHLENLYLTAAREAYKNG